MFFEEMEAYNNFVRVLLEATIDSPIDLLLRDANCTSIAGLRQLIIIKKPGLLRLSRRFGLSDGQYEDRLALESYNIWTDYAGQFDITTSPRGQRYTLTTIFSPFIFMTLTMNTRLPHLKSALATTTLVPLLTQVMIHSPIPTTPKMLTSYQNMVPQQLIPIVAFSRIITRIVG